MDDAELKQRLCAILAADVTGYSRLMAVDERETVAALDSARKVFRSHIESRQGRVIDMARHPAYAQHEIDRQRQQILSGLRVSLEDPDYVADAVFAPCPAHSGAGCARCGGSGEIVDHRALTWRAPAPAEIETDS